MSISRIAGEGFTTDDELYLFGNQGNLETPADITRVHGDKFYLSFGWLATFWEGEIPDEFFDEEEADRREHRSLLMQVQAEIGQDPDAVKLSVRESVVEHAIYKEWLNDYDPPALEDRPIFSTALIHAYAALKDDPLRAAKLGYVVDLAAATHEHWSDKSQETPVLPEPIYIDTLLPPHKPVS